MAKIFHHNDMDGICSAAIIKKEYLNTYGSDIECIEMDYNKEFPFDKIKKDEIIYIVDYSLKPDIMDEELLKITNKVIWIDHHKSIIDEYNSISDNYKYLKNLQGLRINGICATALCWLYYNFDLQTIKLFEENPDLIDESKEIPLVIKYINSWDVWRHTQPDTTEFAIAFDVNIGNNVDKCMEYLDNAIEDHDFISDFKNQGRIMERYRDYYAKITRQRTGRECVIDGIKSYVINAPLYNSEFFGDELDKHDMVCGYNHNGKTYTVSLYSNKDYIDCSETAKKFGGRWT